MSEPKAIEELLARAFERAVRGFDVAARVREALRGMPRPHLVAVGKAATRMLAGALDDSVEDGLLVVPEGSGVAWAPPRVRVVFSDHPTPTERSVRAAHEAVQFVERRQGVCALVSGGASSLIAAPCPGLTIEEKADIVRRLVAAGADIRDVNVVRRHTSTIKGGGLARRARGAVISILVSDVLFGAAHDVGSGPTVADPTTVEHARAVLDRHALSAQLVETLKPGDADAGRLDARIVARPDDLAKAVASELEAEGLTVFDLPPSGDDVHELAKAYVGLAGSLGRGQALVRAAEPVLLIDAAHPGRGGRSSHLAALAGPSLPPGVALLCGASDGVDGSSGGAGAVVTRSSLSSFDVKAALAAFDTGPLHAAAGSRIAGGPTGLNLCDVHVLARA